ncbi:hypothetical protein [Paenibacillus alba]|uniref:Uncharacterized protein n=1 Tax=Paenibacillus alba TaxID=1197127 RepID=A0ABU6GEN1_9BACL|nr:hypothetical protein [Paenibacillus alba]MEC0232673.1 hypothetical protein [Paenibacillus alba]
MGSDERVVESEKIIKQITGMAMEAKTADELHEVLRTIVYTVGGMVCHFVKEDRSQEIMSLLESMGMGLQFTAKAIGEPSDIEMVVGKK